MEFITYKSDVWGREVIRGVSWDLLWLVVVAAFIAIALHAVYEAMQKRGDKPSSEGARVKRHDKIDRIWKNLLTEQELKHTKLTGIKEETLSVCVDSPAWMHQMRMRQTKILKQLKEEVSEIKHIRFKIGTIK